MSDILINPTSTVIVAGLLNVVGKGLKSVPAVNNEWIPFLLCATGAIFYCALEGISRGNAGIGLMTGLSAVGAHQAVRMGAEIVNTSKETKNETNH